MTTSSQITTDDEALFRAWRAAQAEQPTPGRVVLPTNDGSRWEIDETVFDVLIYVHTREHMNLAVANAFARLKGTSTDDLHVDTCPWPLCRQRLRTKKRHCPNCGLPIDPYDFAHGFATADRAYQVLQRVAKRLEQHVLHHGFGPDVTANQIKQLPPALKAIATKKPGRPNPSVAQTADPDDLTRRRQNFLVWLLVVSMILLVILARA